jgi:hypothetical protein
MLLTTQHLGQNTVDPNSGKSEFILAYYESKGGVDTVDLSVAKYSTEMRTRRWPMVVFSNVLDLAGK